MKRLVIKSCKLLGNSYRTKLVGFLFVGVQYCQITKRYLCGNWQIRFCPFFILATWIVTMAVRSPYFVAFQLVEYPRGIKCKKPWSEAFGETTCSNYLLAVAIMFLYIPFVLFLLLYSIILFTHPRGTWGFSKLQGHQYYFPKILGVI